LFGCWGAWGWAYAGGVGRGAFLAAGIGIGIWSYTVVYPRTESLSGYYIPISLFKFLLLTTVIFKTEIRSIFLFPCGAAAHADEERVCVGWAEAWRRSRT
jgi:membrane-bound ClpP family serine protease